MRNQHLKSVAAVGIALQDQATEGGEEGLPDLAVFLMLSLTGIKQTVEQTANAWEKRDYWVKADKFRYEWGWVERMISRLAGVIEEADWAGFRDIGREVREKTQGIQVPRKFLESRPWTGASTPEQNQRPTLPK